MTKVHEITKTEYKLKLDRYIKNTKNHKRHNKNYLKLKLFKN